MNDLETMMRENDFLSLQANIICLLLALIGSAAIIRHPNWFGAVPDIVTPADQPAVNQPVADDAP